MTVVGEVLGQKGPVGRGKVGLPFLFGFSPISEILLTLSFNAVYLSLHNLNITQVTRKII